MATTVRFGRYELHEMLGRGGMGEVYRAFDTEARRLVALKLLPDTVGGDPLLVERFRREAHAAARLRSPHILPVHTFGEIQGRLYIDMRLVDGRDLATRLATDGPLAPERAVAVLGQVAEALDEAHAAQLVHRDVKPSNVLVTDRDFAYLFDFGIAHAIGTATAGTSLTSAGTTVGTLAYMAPERFVTPDRIDGRADVYSLACLLFEMLTGRPPFIAEGGGETMAMHIYEPAPRLHQFAPGLPVELDALIAKMLAKSPDERTPSAAYALAALERAPIDPLGYEVQLTGRPITQPVPIAPPVEERLPRWIPIFVITIAILIAAAAAFFIGTAT
jgi:serine/threonine protein kinase